MKISIIIPVYNVSQYIARCLLSALNQTWQDLEIILVNDCTPDNSIEVIKQVLSSHPRKGIVTLIEHTHTRGVAAARNTGMKKATGEYLFLMDSDDYIPLNAIELLGNVALKYDVTFVMGDYEMTGTGKRWSQSLMLETGLLADNEQVLSTYAKNQWYLMVWNKLMKRAFIHEENLFFPEGIQHEDDLYSFLLASKAKSAYVIHEVTYYYYIHENSFMGKPSPKTLESRIFIICFLYDYIYASSELKENRYIYILFETLKYKFFDRVLYFAKDRDFIYSSYLTVRACSYISPCKAFSKFHPSAVLFFSKLHETFPKQAGFIYWKLYLKFIYYKMIAFIKIKRILKIED